MLALLHAMLKAFLNQWQNKMATLATLMIRSVYYQAIVHSKIDIYRVGSFAALTYSHCICLLEFFVVFKHVRFKQYLQQVELRATIHV